MSGPLSATIMLRPTGPAVELRDTMTLSFLVLKMLTSGSIMMGALLLLGKNIDAARGVPELS